MSDDISLLPEPLRKKEEELKKPRDGQAPAAELKFSSPVEEQEDVEVIEVDEGEIDKVLASEPWLSRLAYKATNAVEGLRHKLFEPNVPPPPPKLPPQFFVPPAAKPIRAPLPTGDAQPMNADGATPGVQKTKARIIPSETAPRRVRVIRRVRKPLRVSFVSTDELRLLQIDVPKRRFTLLFAVFFSLVLLGGGYVLLQMQLRNAGENLQTAVKNTTEIRGQIAEKQSSWSSFQGLEPRLKALGTLLDQQVSPTHVLELIEKNTLPTVSYESFVLSNKGEVVLAVTADSLESAATQILTFKKSSLITRVDAFNYTLTYDAETATAPSAVQFQLGLTLSNEALRPNALVLSH